MGESVKDPHEIMAWPWLVKEGQESDADQIIHNVRAEMKAEMRRTYEDPDGYEWDVLSNGKPVRVGKDAVVEGIGRVPADVVMAGIVVAWRKGTEKPKFRVQGRVA